jgi:predicted glycosyltransferase
VDNARYRRRVLFYSHDGLGLGHLRRTLALAFGVSERRPDTSLLVLTGSSHVHAYGLPPNCAAVTMPAIGNRHLFRKERMEGDGPKAPENIFTVRKAIINAVMESFAPDLIVVDHEPAGLGKELHAALSALSRRAPRPTLVMGLRDITYGPEQTRSDWNADGVYELLDKVYDHILVYGTQAIFDPIEAYGMSSVAAAKTTFTGYIRRPEPVQPAAEIRERLGAQSRPLVVVTVGGGLDGKAVICAYVEALRSTALRGVVSYVIAGPQLPDEDVVELRALANGVPDLVLVQFCDDVVSHVSAADAVVTMGGYNAVSEAVGAGKVPIVIPRDGSSDEQRLRAERFAALGLATHLPSSELTPQRLASAIRQELDRRTSPAVVLDFDGLARASDAIAGALEE